MTTPTRASEQPKVLKLVNRTWRELPDKGEDVYIRDLKLKEGHLGDLSKRSVVQLQEILQRQDKILNNKFLSSKLKDKGERLREMRRKVAEALKAAIQREKNAGDSHTHTYTHTAVDINDMEWKSQRRAESRKEELDSDDDTDEECEDRLDPLKLMAYHSSCVKKPAHNGRVREKEKEEEDPTSAIMQELEQLDLQDTAEEAQNGNVSQCEFGNRRSEMLEEMRRRNGPVRDSFKPFRPVSNPRPIPGMAHHTSRATTTTTLTIPQQEALRLERDFLIKEKERALSDTREQLGRIKTESIGLPPATSRMRYRDANVNKHLLDSDEEEESDCLEDINGYGDE